MVNLNSVFEINERLKALDTEKEFLNCQLCSVRQKNKKFCLAHKFISSIYKLNEDEYKKLCREKFEIYKAISQISDKKTRTFLEYRYIYLMTYEDIAELTNYSLRQVMRIIKEGVKDIDKNKCVC